MNYLKLVLSLSLIITIAQSLPLNLPMEQIVFFFSSENCFFSFLIYYLRSDTGSQEFEKENVGENLANDINFLVYACIQNEVCNYLLSQNTLIFNLIFN